MIYLSHAQADNTFIQKLTTSLTDAGHEITTDITDATTIIVCLSPDYDVTTIPPIDIHTIVLIVRQAEIPTLLAEKTIVDFASYDSGLAQLLDLLPQVKEKKKADRRKVAEEQVDLLLDDEGKGAEITFEAPEEEPAWLEDMEAEEEVAEIAFEDAALDDVLDEDTFATGEEPTYFGGVIPEAEPPPEPKPEKPKASLPPAPGAPQPEPAIDEYVDYDEFSAEEEEKSLARAGRGLFDAQDVLEPPEFTAFYPQAIHPNQSYALMVFMHLPSAIKQVEEIAKGFAGLMGERPTSTSTPSRIRVDVGNLITLVLQLDGLPIQERTLIWQMPQQNVTFPFTTPADLSDDIEGHVTVYQGPLVIGEIPITMQAVDAFRPVDKSLKGQGTFQRYDPIFASYSHRDTPVMEYFRKERERIGVKMLVDIYDLRAGDHWEKRLYDMIDESVVFQLFWSRNSAASPYCRDEWEHALQYDGVRPRFIQPVYWGGKSPNPLPPPELSHIHFQPVELPALTRLQILSSKVRGLFGRK